MSRIRNLIVLILCLIRAAFTGPATGNVSNPRNILIIQRAKLGDMVCTTPMFRAVKQAYPNAHLFVMGNSLNEKLLEGNTHIDGYIVEGSLAKMIRSVKRLRIDFGCTTGPNFENLAILFLSGVKRIVAPIVVGGISLQTRTYMVLVKNVIQKTHKMRHYAPREYLNLLEPIGIFSHDTSKDLYFSKDAESKVRALFKQNGISEADFIVGITPCVGNKIKEWPVERFAQLADYIYGTYRAKIILVGGPNDREKVQEMRKCLGKETRVADFSGLLNIDELKACIARMKLFIGVDTGPIYIAEAFNVPTIDILGPVDEREQSPRGQLHATVYDENRKEPMLHIMNARMYDVMEARRQVEAVTVGQVIQKFDMLKRHIDEDAETKGEV